MLLGKETEKDVLRYKTSVKPFFQIFYIAYKNFQKDHGNLQNFKAYYS